MRSKLALAVASIVGLGLPLSGQASIIAAYNLGPNGTSFTYAATTLAADVTASGINSTNDFGANTVFAPDDGKGGTAGWYSNNSSGPGNYLSISDSGTTDSGFFVETIVTAAAGYVIDPTSFELVGGAGGSSNVRSAYIYDNVDGYPTPPVVNSPFTGGDLLASGAFTTIRGTPSTPPPTMNTIAASFPSTDVNLSSFTVRVYFDTQAQVSKNIDLGSLELDGSVVSVPEPASVGLVLLTGAMACGFRRRRRSALVA